MSDSPRSLKWSAQQVYQVVKPFSLTQEQAAAVELASTTSPSLIVAGAGSGKTRVLTTRIAWLMQTRQVSPAGVLAVTFTNKAAREMLTRLGAMLPVNVRGMWIGTFHGLCNRFLRAHYQLAQLPQTFQILDTQDQLSAIKRLCKQFNVDEDRFPPKQLQYFIGGCKEEGQRPGEEARTGRPALPGLPRGGLPALIEPMSDKLEEIFQMQQALNKRIGVETAGMTEEEKIKWVLNYLRAMQQEIAELIDSVPWKWWAKYQKFDEQNAKVEVIDLFHFLISIAQVLGMSADDVYQAYLKKNAVNHQRQDSGYVKKDENDSRHI